MASLTLKNIPKGLYKKLTDRAAAHRRSINSEILIGLERYLGSTRIDPEAFLSRVETIQKRAKVRRMSSRFIQQAKVRGRS